MTSPLPQLKRWLKDAETAGLPEPSAMALATCTPSGKPSVRIVLCRGFSGDGLRFFTNYRSRKGRELADNPRAAAVLFWQPLGRQARVEGLVEVLSEAESDEYFASRPRGSQIGAWASPQSKPIDRSDLRARYLALSAKFRGRTVPRPPHWGGYRLVLDRVEFWRARPSRLHERELWVRRGTAWQRETVAP
jgi:pyridoxamine 5'-phosphate oxidase